MKKLSFLLLVLWVAGARAQWVSIPDTNFGKWLNIFYPACMQGNSSIGWQMDTICPDVVNDTMVSCTNRSIYDLIGISYFDNLKYLYCASNQLSNLPALPETLIYLSCTNNLLSSLPTLPAGLRTLICSSNQLSGLPALNTGLATLGCSDNQLSSLPVLPSGLTKLYCYNNQLQLLPALPTGLTDLICYNNQLSSLPMLPSGLTALNCSANQLHSLPELPDSMSACTVFYNPLFCLPQLKRIVNLDFGNTNIICLPNYGHVTSSYPNLNSLPLCDVLNSNGCEVYWNISGKVYFDTDTNCLADSAENGIINIPVQLHGNGTLLKQMSTVGAGTYSFVSDTGSFEMSIDTANLPFYVTCPESGVLYDTITIADSLHYNRDFGLRCKPGFDLAAWSITGRFRPGDIRKVDIHVGSSSSFYGINCTNGINGTVTITTTGPAHYVAPAPGALTPSNVAGNVVTYSVADFGTIDFNNSFNIMVQADTSALLGSTICFMVIVTPITGDEVPTNNTQTHCFPVVGSFDPNDKQVYPISEVDVEGDRWLFYTVNFQNTGTDTAIHIYITDTLDAALDESTFQLLAYSVQPMVQIVGGAVRFNFPNINLPDSNVNEPASHGYVQYKVKLKDNLPLGTQVQNTAFIYFDFNAPVVTNTTVNTLTCLPDTTYLSTEICPYESYLFNGVLLNTGGVYYDTLVNAGGCDSLVVFALNILPLPLETISASICSGEVYDFRGTLLSATGVYTDTVSNPTGCDSVIELSLTVHSTWVISVLAVICDNEQYDFNGTLLNTGGAYYDTLNSSNGCDSIIALGLTVFSTSATNISASICDNEQYDFNGVFLNTGGVYHDTLQNGNSCDSVVALFLEVFPTYHDSLNATIVQGNTYTLPSGNTVGDAGVYRDTLFSSDGCDSVIVTNLSVISGISLLEENMSVRIYPNPTSDWVNISVSENLVGSVVVVTDVTGRRILISNMEHRITNIETSGFASGVYFLHFSDKVGNKLVRRLVVE